MDTVAAIKITLPDNSVREVDAGTTPLQIAESIGERLARAAVVAKVDGDLYEPNRGLRADAKRYPGIAALQGLRETQRELTGLMERHDLRRVN